MGEAPEAAWTIERLDRGHDRSAFDCGQPALDDWLKLRASQYQKRDLARTYVALREGELLVRGYYAISTHRVTYEAIPETEARGLPRIDIPVVLLGRLAVDRMVQGRGLGAFLLVDALRRALHVSDEVGIRAVEVDAIDAAARRFYLKYGFRPLRDDPRHLFLPLQVVRKLGLPPIRVSRLENGCNGPTAPYRPGSFTLAR